MSKSKIVSKNNSNEIRWFGFKLTDTQTLIFFTVSLIGVIILSFFLIFTVFSIITFIMFPPSYPGQEEIYIQWLILNIPVNGLFIVFLIICAYTIKKCREKR